MRSDCGNSHASSIKTQNMLNTGHYSQLRMNGQLSSMCKGTYASVRPYRHTYGYYGIRLQTWTRVIVNRSICKIIARDLSLVAS